MRLIQTFIFLIFSASAVLGQAEKPAPISDEVKKLLLEAWGLRKKNRYTDALEKLDAAEKLNPNVADIYALRGDIYLAPRRRDFDLALPQFEKAAQLQPDNPLFKLNLTEYYFVKQEYDTALKALTKLITDYPKLRMDARHMAQYKRVLCELKLGRRSAADEIIAENFTFMDDTPAYYFCKAAISFESGNPSKGNEWIKRAVAAFKFPACEPYYDAFKELRWVPDLDFAPAPSPPKKP